MFKRTKLSTAALLACGGVLTLSGGLSLAQENQALDRVTVTGSNIRRVDAESPSPVQVITAEELKASGYTSTQDVLRNITANGQGTLSQGFSGAFAQGASGVALRGLSVGSTLVLIDGRRMAPYPIGDDGQRSFVDISNIPFDAVERIEVLKDGASAVYGSDAIAGVVNVILKRSFVGKKLSLDAGTSYKGDGNTVHLAGSVGFGDLDKDGQNFFLSGEVRKQKQIRYADRGDMFNRTDFTSSGGFDLTPGVPTAQNSLPFSSTGYVVDPATSTIAGFMPGCDATKFAAGQCAYKDTWSQIQPKTSNYNVLGRYTKNIDVDWQLSVQGSLFRSEAEQVSQPSRTFPNGRQGIAFGPNLAPVIRPATPPTTISNTNPSYPAGATVPSGLLYYQFLDVGPIVTSTDATSTRLIADLQGRVGDWDLSAAAGLTRVKAKFRTQNAVQAELLQAALDSTTNPYLVGGPNSSAVIDSIAPDLNTQATSTLNFLHLGAGRDLMQLQGGPLGMAVGLDYVKRKQNSVAPADVQAGLTTATSNNFTIGEQTVASAYAELVAPVLKELEFGAAVRYDHYNLSGGKASPRLGFKYTPLKGLAVRGTASRGFRAPGPAENGTSGQTFGAQTVADPVLCPDPTNQNAPGNFVGQCNIAAANVQTTNKNLKPETSKSYTLGLIIEPTANFSATIDFYSIEINDQIVTAGLPDPVRGSNFAPILLNGAGGTQTLTVPPVAPISYFPSTYINANTTKTSGVDLGLRFKQRFESLGTFSSEFMVSYTDKYDLTVDGVKYKLAGTHGNYFVSGATGIPKTRMQWSNSLESGPWSVTGTINYTGSMDVTAPELGLDTCASALVNGFGAASSVYPDAIAAGTAPSSICKVKSFTTFDLYARYQLSKQLTISGSVLNLFNRGAPEDWMTYAAANITTPYNPSFHSSGAIGRYFTVGLSYSFD